MPLSGNTPYAKGMKTVTRDVLGPGTAQIDKQSWIRHAARAGCITGHVVGHAARAANEAKVGSIPKARGAARVGVAGDMRCADPGCGHPSRHAVQAKDALRRTGPTNQQKPALTVTSKTGMLGALHTWCPPRMRCPNSSSSRRKS